MFITRFYFPYTFEETANMKSEVYLLIWLVITGFVICMMAISAEIPIPHYASSTGQCLHTDRNRIIQEGFSSIPITKCPNISIYISRASTENDILSIPDNLRSLYRNASVIDNGRNQVLGPKTLRLWYKKPPPNNLSEAFLKRLTCVCSELYDDLQLKYGLEAPSFLPISLYMNNIETASTGDVGMNKTRIVLDPAYFPSPDITSETVYILAQRLATAVTAKYFDPTGNNVHEGISASMAQTLVQESKNAAASLETYYVRQKRWAKNPYSSESLSNPQYAANSSLYMHLVDKYGIKTFGKMISSRVFQNATSPQSQEPFWTELADALDKPLRRVSINWLQDLLTVQWLRDQSRREQIARLVLTCSGTVCTGSQATDKSLVWMTLDASKELEQEKNVPDTLRKNGVVYMSWRGVEPLEAFGFAVYDVDTLLSNARVPDNTRARISVVSLSEESAVDDDITWLLVVVRSHANPVVQESDKGSNYITVDPLNTKIRGRRMLGIMHFKTRLMKGNTASSSATKYKIVVSDERAIIKSDTKKPELSLPVERPVLKGKPGRRPKQTGKVKVPLSVFRYTLDPKLPSYKLPQDGVPCHLIKGNKLPDNVTILSDEKYTKKKDFIMKRVNMLSTHRLDSDNVYLHVIVNVQRQDKSFIPHTITETFMNRIDTVTSNNFNMSPVELMSKALHEASNGKLRTTEIATITVTIPSEHTWSDNLGKNTYTYKWSESGDEIHQMFLYIQNLPSVQAKTKQYSGKLITHIFWMPKLTNVSWSGIATTGTRLHNDDPSSVTPWVIMNMNATDKHAQIFVHEIGHNNGMMHSGSFEYSGNNLVRYSEYGDESGLMGQTGAHQAFSAASAYTGGMLSKIDYVDLSAFQFSSSYDIDVPLNSGVNEHAVVMYLPVVVADPDRNEFSEVLPMPYCVISYRQINRERYYTSSTPLYVPNTKEIAKRVFIHQYNWGQPWGEYLVNPHDPQETKGKTRPSLEKLETTCPLITLIGKLDNTTNTKEIFVNTQQVPLLPYVVNPDLDAVRYANNAKEYNKLAKAIGFPGWNKRDSIPSFSIQLVEMGATKASLRITTYSKDDIDAQVSGHMLATM